ncbi:tetratricopeptide repeat protein [Actinomyces sp. oral taxon 414]|uniref:tetratricopeptide repeat protein n=1 Tax=Actinomyces sp. oral taxon 414 TaxID=712122 RepID=UPI0009F82903
MTDDENRDESEDELRRRAEESFNTGMEAYEHGDWRGALERFERALALYRGVSGSERNQANCLFNSGVVLGELGDWRGALERYERALALYRGGFRQRARPGQLPEQQRCCAGRVG